MKTNASEKELREAAQAFLRNRRPPADGERICSRCQMAAAKFATSSLCEDCDCRGAERFYGCEAPKLPRDFAARFVAKDDDESSWSQAVIYGRESL